MNLTIKPSIRHCCHHQQNKQKKAQNESEILFQTVECQLLIYPASAYLNFRVVWSNAKPNQTKWHWQPLQNVHVNIRMMLQIKSRVALLVFQLVVITNSYSLCVGVVMVTHH